MITNVVRVFCATAASLPFVVLPIVPTTVPFTLTSAKSSAATEIRPKTGCPWTLTRFEKKYCASSDGDVAPVMPGAQIQNACGMVASGAVQPAPNP